MSRLRDFKLPDLGEGLTEGEILSWLVAEGDEVKLNQPIVEVETAKAAVEVPSPYAGVVVSLHHGAGETVDVGSPIITVDTEPGAGPLPDRHAAELQAAGAAANPAETATAAAAVGADRPADDLMPALPDTQDADAPAAGLIGGSAPGGRTAILVGYGPKSVVAQRRARKPVPAPGAGRPDSAGKSAPVVPVVPSRVSAAQVAAAAAAVATAAAPAAGVGPVLAKPPVRRLARDLGVDLRTVTPTGPNGTVSRADVHDAVGASPAHTAAEVAASPAVGPGRGERRIPVKGVRKLIAENMVASAFTAPHVTEFLTCDVTSMMELVTRLRTVPDFAGVKVTPLTLVAKALLIGCRRHPEINASWDSPAQEIVVHGRVNLGIAAATPRGLLVPNIKDADTLGLPALALALAELTATAREGRTQPADVAGGTITITNVGVFGVDTGTPILNPGEAAILCFGVVRDTPWVVDGQIVVRKVTTLGLSFDHRMVDGQLGSEFLSDVGAMLSDPAHLIAWA